MVEYTKAQLTNMIIEKLQRNFGRTVENASTDYMFKACALVIRDIMSRRQMETNNQIWEGQKRQVHYLSLEFLMGRSLEKNAYNLGLLDPLSEALEVWASPPAICSRPSPTPVWATAVWAVWPPAIWTP